jgi:segregation and condensation protein A
MSSSGETFLASASLEAGDADARDQFCIDVDGFEGPLHLLLALARKQKVDLARISILALAEQYLAFIAEARARRIDLAADYLLMAAWLAYLKSRLLLPGEKSDPEEPDAEDVSGRLAFRLQRLEGMRRAAESLKAGRIDGQDVFPRGMPEQPVVLKTPVWTTSLHDVMKAFADVNTRNNRVRRHVIRRQPVLPLDTARKRLSALLPELEDWRPVHRLQPSAEEAEAATGRSVIASFFSAALELARDRALDLRQDRNFGDVYVRRARARSASLKAAE